MKKLYSIIAVATFALSMNAAPTIATRAPKGNQPMSKQIVLGKDQVKKVGQSRADNCIYDVEGEQVIMNRVSSGVLDGEFFCENETPFIMVYGEDGKVYLKNPVTYVAAPTYVVAEKEDNMLHLQLPQPIFYDEEEGITFWLSRMEIVDPDELKYVPSSDEDNSVDYIIYDDGTIELDLGMSPDDETPALVLGVCYGTDFDNLEFYDGGDSYGYIEEMPFDMPELPAGLEFETWTMNEPYYGTCDVDIAFTDTEVYFRGCFIFSPNLWFKATLDEDLIVIEPQFMGIDMEYYQYVSLTFYGLDDEEEWVDQDVVILIYDADSNMIYGEDYYCLVETQLDGNYIDYMEEPTFQNINYDEVDPVPADPTMLQVFAYDIENEFGGFLWSAPLANKDGVPLLNGEFYANLYIDGELLVLTSENFDTEEPMTDIPNNWFAPNGLLMYMSGSLICAFDDPDFTETTFKTLGCQTFHVVDGEKYASNLVTYDTATGEETGINDVVANIKSVKYYNITGAEVANPRGGIFIEISTLTDGSQIARKVRK